MIRGDYILSLAVSDSKINKNTELKRLEHILGKQKEELGYLDKLEAGELFDLKNSIADAILNEHADSWEKLAKVSKFMPNFINAKIAQEVLGPSLTANFTYFIPVKDAINISAHFSKKFMADVSEHLNPSRLEPLLKEFPNERIKKIISELEERNGYYTMGNFLDYMPQDKILTLSEQIKSEETLIRTASYCNKKERLAPVVLSFSDDKAKSLLRKSADLDLCEDVLSVIMHISLADLMKYSDLIASLGDDLIQRYVNSAKQLGGQEFKMFKKLAEPIGVNLD